MFGLDLSPDEMVKAVGAVVTAVLGANTALFVKLLGFMKSESAEMRRMGEEFSRAMASRDKEQRDLIYRIVEQRDKDIHHTQEVLVSTGVALGRVERVLDRQEAQLNARSGH